MAKCRFRFPWPFVGYRDRLGQAVRDLRLDLHRELGRGGVVSQAELARMVGVARETISRIENDAEVPAPATAERLLSVFGKEWAAIAVVGAGGNHTPFLDHERGRWLADMGECLKRGREREGLKLRDVAEASGFSVAQLSRIERGQIGRSRAILEKREHKDQAFGHRAVWFKNPELARLETLGRRLEGGTDTRAQSQQAD